MSCHFHPERISICFYRVPTTISVSFFPSEAWINLNCKQDLFNSANINYRLHFESAVPPYKMRQLTETCEQRRVLFCSNLRATVTVLVKPNDQLLLNWFFFWLYKTHQLWLLYLVSNIPADFGLKADLVNSLTDL